MPATEYSDPQAGELDQALTEVRRRLSTVARGTPAASLPFDFDGFIGGGKLLRSRAAIRAGLATGRPIEDLIRSATAVELVHAASLLHDDVIDGGSLRRGSPAFWVTFGAPGAILLGDLLLCRSLGMLQEASDPSLRDLLIAHTAETCSAEIEQELLLRGTPADWDAALRFARHKTGPLFAFAAGAGGPPGPIRSALLEAGAIAGTAYQLSDDVLDLMGSPDAAGKTLGRDAARAKTTAVNANGGNSGRALDHLAELRRQSIAALASWPAVAKAWSVYWEADLGPSIERNVEGAAAAAR